eukprot:342956-Chlamydomonas_euryale.AAC.3
MGALECFPPACTPPCAPAPTKLAHDFSTHPTPSPPPSPSCPPQSPCRLAGTPPLPPVMRAVIDAFLVHKRIASAPPMLICLPFRASSRTRVPKRGVGLHERASFPRTSSCPRASRPNAAALLAK